MRPSILPSARGQAGDEPDGRAPIVVGVTGHRDIPVGDEPALESAIGSFFDSLMRDHPHTPIKLMSMLAVGADTIAAHAAVARGIGLIVPLPLELSDYLQDFASAAAQQELRRLLALAERSFVVRRADGADDPGDGRPSCYVRSGTYIAGQCLILLAVWDGGVSGKPGGTDEIVRRKLQGLRRPGSGTLIDRVGTGAVCRVVARRASRPATPDDLFHLRFLLADGDSWEDPAGGIATAADADADADSGVTQICARIDEFNRDASSLATARIAASRAYLLADIAPERLDRDDWANAQGYAVADALAQSFQARTRMALGALFWDVFLAVLAFELWAHHVWRAWPILLAYITLLCAAYLVHRLANTWRFHPKYLDYRAIAEGLRVQFYWRVAGLTDSAADRYVRQQMSELEWIRAAVRCFEPSPSAPAARLTERRIATVMTSWVDGQYSYFSSALKREHASIESWERWTQRLIVAGLIAAMVGLALAKVGSTDGEEYAVLGMALPPLVAALLHGYSEKRAFASHVKRYRHIYFLYRQAKQDLSRALDERNLAAAAEVLRELGTAALWENGDWVLLHRDRPLEVPHAG